MSGGEAKAKDQAIQQPAGVEQLGEEELAALQQQLQQTRPENVTPQLLSQMFGITEEVAALIIQELPTLCQIATTPTEEQFEQAVEQVAQPQINSTDQDEFEKEILEMLDLTKEEMEDLEEGGALAYQLMLQAAGLDQFDDLMDQDYVTDEEREMFKDISGPVLTVILTAVDEMERFAPYIIAKNDWENVPWPEYLTEDQIPQVQFLLRELLPRARATGGIRRTRRPRRIQAPAEELEEAVSSGAFDPLGPFFPQLGRLLIQNLFQQPAQQQFQPRQVTPQPQQIRQPTARPTATPARRRVRLPFGAEGDEKDAFMDEISVDIVEDSVVVKDGILTADAIMTAAMVQSYGDKKILKDPEELKKACDAWKAGLPITNRHPPAGVVMNQDEIMGWTTPPVWDEDNQRVTCSIEVIDGATIKAIEDGKTDVSIGFYADEDNSEGTFGDDPYDSVQRNIVLNHFAVAIDRGHGRCPNGVCGIETDCVCVIPDEFEAHCIVCDKSITTKERADLMTIACPDCGSGLTRTPSTDGTCPCCDHYDELAEDIEEDARLTAAQRKALSAGTFCGPDRSFPVPDCAHYTAALRLLGRYKGPGDKGLIRNCIIRKGRAMDCPGAAEMDIDEEADAAILARQITNIPSKEELSGGAPDYYELLAGRPDTHNHFAQLDKDGNGTSTVNSEHSHKIVNFNVELANDHSHQLAAASKPQEEPPMSDEEKNKKDTGEDGQTNVEPKTDGETKVDEPKTEKPPVKTDEKGDDGGTKEKTDAEKALDEKKTELIDKIMDMKPPFERDHFEGKDSLDELEEDFKLLQSQQDATKIPGKSGSNGVDAVQDEKDKEYADLERKLKTQ